MIKPNELRVGNYVDRPGFGMYRITAIQHYQVRTNLGCLPYMAIKPIPITSEWLLKFGFTKSSCHDSRNIFNMVPLYENNGVAIMLSDSEFWYVTRQYDGGSSDPFERVLEVKSVHQVQNLYYALTGEELTIQE